jgi:hypothetical protein
MYNFPSSQRLQELLGTTFPIEQKHRLQWIRQHLDTSWDPDKVWFLEPLLDQRLMIYTQVEMKKCGLTLRNNLTRDERIAAHNAFISNAQILDTADRLRNIRL